MRLRINPDGVSMSLGCAMTIAIFLLVMQLIVLVGLLVR